MRFMMGVVLCFVIFVGTVAAEGPITCALIVDPALGLPDSASFNLLGVELSKAPGLTLLERAEVDKILKERTLQLALSAEGVAERRALGTLLQARLLVVLRAGEAKVGGKTVRYADLVACETAQGLRLVRDRIPWDDSAPQALATAAAADVALARGRLAEPARAIMAVPPFISGDLEYRHDAMQDACALLVGESLAATPGLRLVELAEARAIAEEMKLGTAAALSRDLLPCFLTGGYRNEGADPTRKVTLTLELRQGERPLGERKSGSLAPEAIADYLKSTTRELLGQALALPAAAFDPAAERAELTRLAHQFQSLGEWERALNLTEAALLLAPDDMALRKLALDLTMQAVNGAAIDADSIRRAIAINLRGLDHYEWMNRWAEQGASRMPPRERLKFYDDLGTFWKAGSEPYWAITQNPKDKAELAPQLTALGKTKREISVEKIENQKSYTGNWDLVDGRDPLYVYVPIAEPAAEKYQAYLRAIKAWCRQSGGQHLDYGRLLERIKPAKGEDKTAYLEFLARVAELPGRQHELLAQYGRLGLEPLPDDARQARLRELVKLVQAARIDRAPERALIDLLENDIKAIDDALALQKESDRYRKLDAAQAQRPTPTPKPMPAPPPDADFTLTAIPEVKIVPLGWIKGGGTTDLIWDRDRIYTMSRPGELTALVALRPPEGSWDSPGWRTHWENGVLRYELLNPMPGIIFQAPDDAEKNGHWGNFKEVVSDGRWAWAPLHNRLLVLDPAARSYTMLGAAEGLPAGDMCVAPLGPGRVCVVGGFGRAWCAVVAYDGVKAKVDIFHEARLASGEWTDHGLAFTPRYAVTMRGADGHPRVLVGREMKGRGRFLPLLLDPERRTPRPFRSASRGIWRPRTSSNTKAIFTGWPIPMRPPIPSPDIPLPCSIAPACWRSVSGRPVCWRGGLRSVAISRRLSLGVPTSSWVFKTGSASASTPPKRAGLRPSIGKASGPSNCKARPHPACSGFPNAASRITSGWC